LKGLFQIIDGLKCCKNLQSPPFVIYSFEDILKVFPALSISKFFLSLIHLHRITGGILLVSTYSKQATTLTASPSSPGVAVETLLLASTVNSF
jgi:hypothetical protein